MGVSERIGSETLRTVKKQIESARPPEALAAYETLLAQGYSRAEARRRIGLVVAEFVLDGLRNQKGLDLSEYVRALGRLSVCARPSS